ncbi:hypothetical protein [Pseudomonas sp. CGJS7]|uniref:hypothetical protein n=1 Tax=Pseudomonas sp. CGJS7 TaxID=3109348 RepID=UPI00300B0951
MTDSAHSITRNCKFHIAALAVFFVGCTHHQEKLDGAELDIQRLIRVPAERGRAGVDQITSSLQRLYDVEPGTQLSPLSNTHQPVTLADGTVIAQTLTDVNATHDPTRDVRVDLANRPCVPIERAAAWIGAKRLFATAGDEKVTGHVDYLFENSAVRIDLVGDFPGPECLRVVTIYKQP